MKIEILEPAYEGMAKLLHEFVELYKVCDNKELIDKCLEKAFVPPYRIHANELDEEKIEYKTNTGDVLFKQD